VMVGLSSWGRRSTAGFERATRSKSTASGSIGPSSGTLQIRPHLYAHPARITMHLQGT
jgi:hypothetical protein